MNDMMSQELLGFVHDVATSHIPLLSISTEHCPHSFLSLLWPGYAPNINPNVNRSLSILPNLSSPFSTSLAADVAVLLRNLSPSH